VNSRRTVILLVAIVIGALAAFGLLNYVRGLEDSAYEGQQLLEVWVVTEPIPRGTPAEQVIATGLIAKSEVPVDFRPATAIQDPTSELTGLVAITDLPANAVLVTGNFVAPSVVATGVTDRLAEKGMVTLTFSLDQVRSAAYLLEPGDYVNILAELPLGDEEGTADPAAPVAFEESSQYSSDVRYLYQRVEVLAIDKALTADLGDAAATEGDPAAAAAGNPGMITLAVPPEAVQRVLAIGLNNLYLSLVPSSFQPVAIPPLDLNEDLLPGEDATRLTPYGPDAVVTDQETANAGE
jgi:pilus assembly protein CpaB